MNVTAFDVARRFIGVKERQGVDDHPVIRWAHSLTIGGEMADEIAWCSSFMQIPSFLLDLPRTRSKAARSWLGVDAPAVPFEQARIGFDVVILKRGQGAQPGPEVLVAPGHVTMFGGEVNGGYFTGLGGNQSDAVGFGRFRVADVLGVRRLYP